MLMIRLARVGKKKHPTFRLVVSEKTKDTKGNFLELLGSYDPHASPAKVAVNAERISYWLTHGAQPSGTVHNILVDQNIIKGEKIRVANIRKKAEEKKAEAAAVTPAAAEKPTEVSEQAKAEAEKPVEPTAEPAQPKPEPKEEERKEEKAAG